MRSTKGDFHITRSKHVLSHVEGKILKDLGKKQLTVSPGEEFFCKHMYAIKIH